MSSEQKIKSETVWLGELVSAFQKAIIDRLADAAKANVVNGVATYVPSTDTLKAAAFAAWQEMIESNTEKDAEGNDRPISPMLAVACWESVLKINESAFRQHLERKAKAKELTFAVGGGTRSVKSIATGYLSS